MEDIENRIEGYLENLDGNYGYDLDINQERGEADLNISYNQDCKRPRVGQFVDMIIEELDIGSFDTRVEVNPEGFTSVVLSEDKSYAEEV